MVENANKPEALPPQGYYIAVPPPRLEGSGTYLPDYWGAFVRYKWTIVSVVLVCTVLSALYAILATPTYRASVLMAPVSDAESTSALSRVAAQYGGLASMVGIDLGAASGSKGEAIAELKSRGFTYQFIKDHELLPVLFAKKWDATRQTWNVDHADDVPTLGDAYRLFDKKIRHVEEDKNTGLVTLSIDWKNRAQAAAWANKLVKQVNRRMRERAISEAQRSIDYLEKELGRTSVVDFRRGINRLIESQLKNIMVANVREQYSFRIIDPAVVPDKSAYVWPRRGLVIALGTILGLITSVFVVFAANAMQPNLPQG